MTANLMIFRLVAVNTEEVITSHVHIHSFRGIKQAAVQVAVLDGIAAAAVEMAAAAVEAGGGGYALRRHS